VNCALASRVTQRTSPDRGNTGSPSRCRVSRPNGACCGVLRSQDVDRPLGACRVRATRRPGQHPLPGSPEVRVLIDVERRGGVRGALCGPDVFFDTPRALCGSAEPTDLSRPEGPAVIDNQLPGVYPQHASGTNSEQPTPRTTLDRVVVSVGDRAVHYGNGQSGLIAFACTGTLNPLGQSGRRGSRA
jgi:hypothetical protein